MKFFENKLITNSSCVLPVGYSEETAADEIYKSVLLMMAEKKENKDKLLDSTTSSLTLKTAINYTHKLLSEFKRRFPDVFSSFNEEQLKTIETTFLEIIFASTLIFYNNKKIHGESIQIPVGSEFEEYFTKKITEFESSSEFADTLIPGYLFEAIKKVAIFTFLAFEKEGFFVQADAEFKESALLQLIHLFSVIVATYLIQDSFLSRN